MDDRDGVLGGVVGGDALHRGHHDVAGLVLGLLARGSLDRAGEPDGVVLGLLADRLEQHRLGVIGAEPGHALQRDDLFLGRAGEVLAGLVEIALPLEELAIALLEHLAALVELLVALGQAPLLRGQLVRAARVPRPRPHAEPELLVLGLEDQLLLAGPRFCLDPAGLGLRGLHALGCPHRADQCAQQDADGGGQRGHRHHDRCLHRFPPIRTGSCGRTRQRCDDTITRRGGGAVDRLGRWPGPGRHDDGPAPSMGRDRAGSSFGTPLTIGAWNVAD